MATNWTNSEIFQALLRNIVEQIPGDEAQPLGEGDHEIILAALLENNDLLDRYLLVGKEHPELVDHLVGLAHCVLSQQQKLVTEGPGLLARIMARGLQLGLDQVTLARFEQEWERGLALYDD